MNLLSDSFAVLKDHWRLILGILLILLVCQSLVSSALRLIFGNRLTSAEYYSLGIAGWMLPLALASGLWLVFGILQRPALSAVIVIASLAILALILFLRTIQEPLRDSKTTLLVLLALSGLTVFLRLAFISKAVIPMYFDSAQHYFLIRSFLGEPASSGISILTWPSTGYYHIGYHLLSALITSALQTDIIQVMLILGQIILVTIPLSVFTLIKQETQSSRAAVFSVLLAAFGWYMPAYAVNWGKYPALASLPLITFVLSIAYLTLRYRHALSPGKYGWLAGTLLLAILGTGLTHSRSLVIFGIVLLATLAANWRAKLPRISRTLFFYAVLLGIVLEIFLIQKEGVFGPLFDPYGPKGYLVTSIVVLLSVFAQKSYPRLTFASIVAILLLLASLFIPVSGIPGYGRLTLLDRPFIEMILYLPLALIGGLGLAGLEQRFEAARVMGQGSPVSWGKYLPVIVVGAVLINALAQYTFYPSDCCAIVGRDDLVAMDWMDTNLPADARIVISSTELRVLATDAFQGAASGDAGAWINPLIHRPTISLPFQSDLSQQTTFDSLCAMQAGYIYIGDTGLRFNHDQIIVHPDWYKILLSMPNVKVYQLIGCG